MQGERSGVEEATAQVQADSNIFSAVRHGDLERVRYLVRPLALPCTSSLLVHCSGTRSQTQLAHTYAL